MMVSNGEIAKALREIGEYLEMQNIQFKPRAYERAAQAIESLDEEAAAIYHEAGLEGLEAIPGVGVSIAEKFEELLKTGRLRYYAKLKKAMPVRLDELTRIEGLGPKHVARLYKELGVRTVHDLERAAKAGRIAKLEGFGKKSEEKILRGIGFQKEAGRRFSIAYVAPLIRAIEERLRAAPGVLRAVAAGSYRRRKETIGDADFLVVSRAPARAVEFFTSMPEVGHVYAKGRTKALVRLKNGLDADLRAVPEVSYGAALHYFTGSKDHNVALREAAQKKGWKLNEYGLFRGGRRFAGKTEEEVYRAFGMAYVEPELRECRGELERARAHRMPELIGYGDLKGDTQVHTTWSDGSASVLVMAEAARKAGLRYIVVTDHSARLRMTHGLDARAAARQRREIDAVNRRFGTRTFVVFQGIECDILKDGLLDMPDEALRQFHVVGVAVHSHFGLSREVQTRRIVRALQHPSVHVLHHPTGRLIGRRKAYEVDIDVVIAAAKRLGRALEIDASPDRLDLHDEHIRKCVEAGVKMTIGSDAHSVQGFSYLEYGVVQARRGWASGRDILNTLPAERFLARLKGGRKGR